MVRLTQRYGAAAASAFETLLTTIAAGGAGLTLAGL